MAKERKNFFTRTLPKGNPTHAVIMIGAGGYVIYMAYMMIRNMLDGTSTMGMATTIVIAAIMALVGLGIIGYGICIWRSYVKQYKKDTEQEDDDA